MIDISVIGIGADTTGIKKGVTDLDKFSKSADKVSGSVNKTSKSIDKTGVHADKLGKKINKAESKFKSFGKNAGAAVAAIDGPMGGISSRISSMTTLLTSGTAAISILATGTAAFVATLAMGIKETDKFNLELAKSAAIIRSTGSAAGKTSIQLRMQAQELAHATLASTEGVMAAQAKLLSFDRVSGEMFDRSLKAAQGLSDLYGGDIQSSIVSIAKAMQDPIKGYTMLSRSGTTFTDVQIKMIKKAQESGDMFAAQTIIMENLEHQLGNISEKMAAQSNAGEWDEIGQNIQELTMKMSTLTGATSAWSRMLHGAVIASQDVNKALTPENAGQMFDRSIGMLFTISKEREKMTKMHGRGQAAQLVYINTLEKARLKLLKDITATAKGENAARKDGYNAEIAAARLARDNALTDAKAIADAKREKNDKREAAKAEEELTKNKNLAQSITDSIDPASRLRREIEKTRELMSTPVDKASPFGGNLLSGEMGEVHIIKLQAQITSIDTAKFETLKSDMKSTFGDLLTPVSGFFETFEQGIDRISAKILEMPTGTIAEKQQKASALNQLNHIKEAKLEKTKEKNTAKFRKAGDVFFGKNKKYKETMMKIDTAMAMLEQANIIKTMLMETASVAPHIAAEGAKAESNSLTAITSAFSASFPLGFAAGAAMIGIMSSLLGGSSGGSGSQAPVSQGTGTLLGSAEQSESISRANEKLEDIQIDQLAELRGIKDAVYAIASGSDRAATLYSRQGQLFSGQLGEQGSWQDDPFMASGISFIDNIAGKIIGKVFGNLLGGGSSTNITDAGIGLGNQNYEDILNTGRATGGTYEDIKVRKHHTLFHGGSSSYSTVTKALSDDMQIQIGGVFKNIGSAITQATDLLGVDVNDKIKNYTFKVGNISLLGKSGEDVQKELKAVFSAQSDLMAGKMIPEMLDFQKVGEGLFETLIRVSSEQVNFTDNIERLGIAVTGLSGVKGWEAAQNVISLSGGIDKFNSSANTYFKEFFTKEEQTANLKKSLTEATEKMNISMFKSRAEYRAMITGIDISTESGQQLYANLVSLASPMDEFFDTVESGKGKVDALSKSLRNAISGVYTIGSAASSQSLDYALAEARIGNLDPAKKLNVNSLLPKSASFSSKADFMLQQSITANKMAELADISDGKLTIEQLSLKTQESQVSILSSIDATLKSDYEIKAPAQSQRGSESAIIVELSAIRAELMRIRESNDKIEGYTDDMQDDLSRIKTNGIRVEGA